MKKVICGGILSLFLIQVSGQDQAVVQKLTFKEAVKIGLEKNVNLNQQKNTLYSRQVQRNQSRAAFTPIVYAQGQASRNEGQQPNPTDGTFENLTVDQLFGSLNAEMPIFNGFTRVNTLKQNSQLFKAQISLVKRAEQEVIFNVTSQYLQVLLDQELLRIALENHATQQVLLNQLSEQVAVGSRAESEKMTQEAQVKNMELIALRAKVALDNDKATLSQTLQLDPAIAFEVTFPEGLTDHTYVDGMPLDSLYQIAFEHREDLKQQGYVMASNQSAYRSVASGYYPRLTAFFNYGSVYYSTIPSNFKDQFWDQNLNYTYGLNFYIPIYDRLTTRSTRVSNKVFYDNSKLQYENLEKAIKIDVQRAVNNYKAAIQASNSSLVQFQAGELALKTQQESFLLGVSDQVTVAQANQTFVVAAASRAQAEVTLLFQRILLDYALGTLKVEDIQ
jgi:outer membrane protein